MSIPSKRKNTLMHSNRLSGNLGSSMRGFGGGISGIGGGGVKDDDGDMISEWRPPANDFYNKAARLSCWSRS